MELLLVPLAFFLPYAWIIAILAAVFLCFVLEDHSWLLTLGSVLLVVAGGAALHLYDWHVIVAHPVLIPLILAAYVVAGTVWVWVAWLSFLTLTREKAEEFGEEFDKLPANRGIKTKYVDRPSAERRGVDRVDVPLSSEELVVARAQYVKERIGFALPPQVKEHKARIIRYMTYWPFSVIRTILKDPIRRLYNYLYRSFGTRLQAMSDKAFQGH